MKQLSTFCGNAKIPRIESLYIHGGTKATMNGLIEALPNLLRVTNNWVYFDCFELQQSDLEIIFAHCQNATKLAFVNCKMGPLDKQFRIQADHRYGFFILGLRD